ncbi:MAG: NAD(P)-dependent oxidoreductase [Paracoccaceae bacterium]|nr:NAD(P)-dependent oxidoreductase [Paracoccaceae bacterium]
MKFGFVGLGQMGAPMAINLSRENDVRIFDKKKKPMVELVNKRAQAVNTIEQFSDVNVLILCLPNVETVQQVLFNSEDGLTKYLKKGTIVIDTSTSDYSATLNIANELNKLKIDFLDAPVSGMRHRAQNGTLSMMVGGDSKILEVVKPALSTIASKIIFMGASGSGQLTKLINQLLFDINMAGLAEILPMSRKLGLDPEQVTEIINSGTGRSYASEFFLPNIIKGDFEKGYPMQAAYKDLISGANISSQQKIPTPVLAAATANYQKALQEGHGTKDKGAMILVYERLLKVAFRASGKINKNL